MSRLQIWLFGPYFSSFLVHSYGYEPAIELKSVLKHPNFASARIVRQTASDEQA
jgi:hypothetical protein